MRDRLTCHRLAACGHHRQRNWLGIVEQLNRAGGLHQRVEGQGLTGYLGTRQALMRIERPKMKNAIGQQLALRQAVKQTCIVLRVVRRHGEGAVGELGKGLSTPHHYHARPGVADSLDDAGRQLRAVAKQQPGLAALHAPTVCGWQGLGLPLRH